MLLNFSQNLQYFNAIKEGIHYNVDIIHILYHRMRLQTKQRLITYLIKDEKAFSQQWERKNRTNMYC